MKGSFVIRHDPYTSELFFGNLPQEDHFSLGFSTNFSHSSMTIAHDVVEHSTKHRKAKYLTYEEELRAIGAIQYVRDAHSSYDVAEQIRGILVSAGRDIKRPPKIICDHLDKTFISNFLDEEYIQEILVKYHEFDEPISEYQMQSVYYQFHWGYLMKMWYETKHKTSLITAFQFIEKNIGTVIEDISCKESYGATVYFDSNKHIFRWKMKWRS